MKVFEILRNFASPKLGKFGEYLAREYWENLGSTVHPWHRDCVDFNVNGVQYDVKTSRKALDKNEAFDSRLPRFYGRRKEGVRILVVGIYSNCAVLVEEGILLQRLDHKLLEKHWHEHKMPSRSTTKDRLPLREEHTKWLKAQKERIREICAKSNLKVRIISRNGVETQKKFGKWAPNNLIPADLKKEEATVCLWTEGCSLHRVIAFRHSDVGMLPLYSYTPPNLKPIQAMPLYEFEKFRGKFCFVSLEEFESKFFSR